MAEGKLFSYCRRWNSGIKAKLLIFQKFSGDVNSSFGYLLGGTDELGASKRFSLLLFGQTEDLSSVIKDFSGCRAGRFECSFTDRCLPSTVFQLSFFSPKALDLHSSQLKQPCLQHFASICPCAPRQRICLPGILPCCCAVLWEEQLKVPWTVFQLVLPSKVGILQSRNTALSCAGRLGSSVPPSPRAVSGGQGGMPSPEQGGWLCQHRLLQPRLRQGAKTLCCLDLHGSLQK